MSSSATVSFCNLCFILSLHWQIDCLITHRQSGHSSSSYNVCLGEEFSNVESDTSLTSNHVTKCFLMLALQSSRTSSYPSNDGLDMLSLFFCASIVAVSVSVWRACWRLWRASKSKQSWCNPDLPFLLVRATVDRDRLRHTAAPGTRLGTPKTPMDRGHVCAGDEMYLCRMGRITTGLLRMATLTFDTSRPRLKMTVLESLPAWLKPVLVPTESGPSAVEKRLLCGGLDSVEV